VLSRVKKPMGFSSTATLCYVFYHQLFPLVSGRVVAILEISWVKEAQPWIRLGLLSESGCTERTLSGFSYPKACSTVHLRIPPLHPLGAAEFDRTNVIFLFRFGSRWRSKHELGSASSNQPSWLRRWVASRRSVVEEPRASVESFSECRTARNSLPWTPAELPTTPVL